MAAVSKEFSTYHTAIKIKSIDVKSGSYAGYGIDSNARDAEFKIGDHVRMSKCKNIFAKGHASNWCEEMFVISKVKNTVPWTYAISDLNAEEIDGTFYKKEFRRKIKHNLG